MSSAELLKWFDELVARGETFQVVQAEHGGNSRLAVKDCHAWLSSAESALGSSLPSEHAIKKRWDNLVKSSRAVTVPVVFASFLGVLTAARDLIRDGRLGSLIDRIRSETEGELLDQADALLRSYRVAAAVIAGGALETHLRHLLSKLKLAIPVPGSIDKYDGIIAQARNAGNEIYTANLGKLVKAWGGIRNDAAHDPGNFKWSEDDVRRMIEGVRDFIDRTTAK
jgi:hypothetical protein